MSTPIFQDMFPTKLVKNQAQGQVQIFKKEHGQKETLNTRVIDETTLKIYLPKKLVKTSTLPSSSLSPPMILTSDVTISSISQDKDIKKNKVRLCFNTPTASYIRSPRHWCRISNCRTSGELCGLSMSIFTCY